jgi:hypothetical protein
MNNLFITVFILVLLLLIVVLKFVFDITIQGKMNGGLTKSEAFKQILKELFGL